jgi:hypothetical protein
MRAITLCAALFSIIGTVSGAPPESAGKPDIRISVKATSEGTERGKKGSRVASRRLQIHIENREHRELAGLQLEWKIIGEDINSKQNKVDASGKQALKLAADEVTDVQSGVAQFAEQEGGVKTVGKGKTQRKVPQPDKGRSYAGYVVEIKQGGQVIAEASTLGIRKQTKGL